MNKFVYFFYSYDKEYLKILQTGTHNCFGDSITSVVFQNKEELLEHLKNSSPKNKIHTIILNVEDSNHSTLKFINQVNQNYSAAIKLVISESTHLLKIQKHLKELDSYSFVNRSCSPEDFELALNTAKKDYSNLQTVIQYKSEFATNQKNTKENISSQIGLLNDVDPATEKFFAIIAHDLKSPFTGLLGISDILITEWKELSDNEKLELINASKQSTENTFKLLENMLNWYKSRKNGKLLKPSFFNVPQLIESTIDLLKYNAKNKGITIENEVNNNTQLFADKNMIATIFRNLISNAINHIPETSSIKIWMNSNNEFHIFCVEDNGEGVREQHIIDFFSPIPGHSEKKNDRFTGLGLLICKDFVEQNNGQIWLKSEKGKGSKFYFSVPIKKVRQN